MVLDKCLKNTPVQFLPFAMLGYLDICKGTILAVQNLTLYCNKLDSVIQLFRWVHKSSLAEEQTLDLFFLYAIEPEICIPVNRLSYTYSCVRECECVSVCVCVCVCVSVCVCL